MPARLPVHLCGRRLDSTAHVCAFFDSDEELYSAILPYFAEGLSHGEQVVSICEKADQPERLDRMIAAGIAVAPAMEADQLKLFCPEETYLAEGAFDVASMLSRVDTLLDEAKSSHFRFLRTCGDMSWALGALTNTDALMEYEARLGFLLRRHECTLMCAYDTRKFSRATFKDILSTHPQVLIGTTIVENPFYVSPMEFLKELLARGPQPLERPPGATEH